MRQRELRPMKIFPFIPYTLAALTVSLYGNDLGTTQHKLHLEAQARQGNQQAQHLLNEAARHGELGFTETTGRLYLEYQARQKDLHAQQLLNIAALNREFGFTKTTGRLYLETRSRQGDKHAQQKLTETSDIT